jgi:hypothetical protein
LRYIAERKFWDWNDHSPAGIVINYDIYIVKLACHGKRKRNSAEKEKG